MVLIYVLGYFLCVCIYVLCFRVCVKMSAPVFSSLIDFGIKSTDTLEVRPSDTLLVMMQPRCPDSKALRDKLRSVSFTSENGRVYYVNAHGNGELMTTAFGSAGKGSYPSYDAEVYSKINKRVGSVLPKVYKCSVGGTVDGVYYMNHGAGLKEVRLV